MRSPGTEWGLVYACRALLAGLGGGDTSGSPSTSNLLRKGSRWQPAHRTETCQPWYHDLGRHWNGELANVVDSVRERSRRRSSLALSALHIMLKLALAVISHSVYTFPAHTVYVLAIL